MRIYTDASTRSKISGLGYIATTSKHTEIQKDGMVINQIDNNTAELQAIIYAIEETQYLLQENEKTIIFTDSTYVINAIRNNHYRAEEEPLVKKIQNMMEYSDYQLFHVKGHCQDGTVLSHFNKKADKMSKFVRKEYEKELEHTKKEKRLLAIAKSKLLKDNKDLYF